jgi:hypothetical protein
LEMFEIDTVMPNGAKNQTVTHAGRELPFAP